MAVGHGGGGLFWLSRVILIGCQVPCKCASMVYCLAIQKPVAADGDRLPNRSKACSESRIEENERD
jgi:hypothetical protein